jgi:gamma-glutamylputrescine oxidase
MQLSFWEKNHIEKAADFTIIGAGIVGLSTAISLKEKAPNARVVVFERGNLPLGASTKNAGFACFGSVSELLDDLESMGEDKTMEIVQMRILGLEKLIDRCGAKNIEYHKNGGVELFRTTDNTLQEKCFDELGKINKIMMSHFGIEHCYQKRDNTYFPNLSNRVIFNPQEGLLNPMKMMITLQRLCHQKGVEIYYGINVSAIDSTSKSICIAEGWNIAYRHLIICTNGFTKSLLPELKVHPARNQVLITKPLEIELTTFGFHIDKGYLYFRAVGNRILLGGGRNTSLEEETTSKFGLTDSIQQYLKEVLNQIVPGANQHIDMWWSGIMGVGAEKKPILRSMDDHITVGVRLGGMGVAIGSQLGEEISDLVLGKR